MAKPYLRNPDLVEVLPHREWLRKNGPEGSEGYVVEDIDLVVRTYGENFVGQYLGQFMLIELKFGDAQSDTAQKYTFGLIDQLLSLADPDRKRYLGYFLVQYDNEDWDLASFCVNGVQLNKEDYVQFCCYLNRNLIEYVRKNGRYPFSRPNGCIPCP